MANIPVRTSTPQPGNISTQQSQTLRSQVSPDPSTHWGSVGSRRQLLPVTQPYLSPRLKLYYWSSSYRAQHLLPSPWPLSFQIWKTIICESIHVPPLTIYLSSPKSPTCCGGLRGFCLENTSLSYSSRISAKAILCVLSSPVWNICWQDCCLTLAGGNLPTSEASWQLLEAFSAPDYFKASVKWVKTNPSKQFF